MMISIRPPLVRPVRKTKVIRSDLNQGIALTGKFLGLFVLFTSSMNWWHYKRTREEREKDKRG